MGSLSDVYENKALDALIGSGRAAAMPATVYVALFTIAPSDSAAGTEVAAADYQRVAVANTDAQWTVAANSEKKNINAIIFPTAGTAWGTVVAYAIMDATLAAGGNRIFWGAVNTAQVIAVGQTAQFAANGLVLKAD